MADELDGTNVPPEGEDGWICPITKRCSKSKLHRRCKGPGCGKRDCYDCCSSCQDPSECRGPSDNVDYELPAGEHF